MRVNEQLGLRCDPFGPADAVSGFGMAGPVQAAVDCLMTAVSRGDPLTVLAGRPGFGKTLALAAVAAAARADGLRVESVARGDMAHRALGCGADLLLIDEADTINAATLAALAPGTMNAAAPMMIFAATQPALHRLSGSVRTTIVDLRPLEAEEARAFLIDRTAAAGRAGLIAPEALDVLVEAGRGSPRLLRVLAGAAMFQAASSGAAAIGAEHASLAATMHGGLIGGPPAVPRLPIAANDAVPPADETVDDYAIAATAGPRARPVRRRAGLLSFAASVALAALMLPVFFAPQSAGGSVAPDAPRVPDAPSAPMRLAAAFTVAPAQAAETGVPYRAGLQLAAVRPLSGTGLRPADVAAPVIAVTPRVAVVRPLVARVDGIARFRERPGSTALPDRRLLVDVLAAARVRPAPAPAAAGDGVQQAAELRLTERLLPIAPVARPILPPERPVVQLAAADITAVRQVAAPVTTAREIVRDAAAAKASTEAAKDAAKAAKAGADDAKATKTVAVEAKSVKLAASEAKAVKATAAQAKATRETADAAKDAADAAKRVKDSADTARVAKESAKAAKDSSDAAKGVKESVESARVAKEAAKAVKDSAEAAKAAKDSADAARIAKEAADAAKAAKDSADAAKAAKDATEQARAAKDAAEQARAAKDAAEQAKAAKDAADAAKAAKDAADAAKAAKDSADLAKAAKDSVDQARVAKEAAKAAKDAAKAAKDLTKAVKLGT